VENVLWALVEKEVKDLIRDPRIWIPVLIGFLVLPIMGVIQNISVSSQISQGYGAQVSVQVLLLDSYDGSRDFLEILKNVMRSYNMSYIDKEGSFPKEADALVIINASSIESLAKGRRIEALCFIRLDLPAHCPRRMWQ
jgi:ABC-2 type transport system permease protein